MAGSESETILRAKAVKALRAALPGGRIINELDLGARRLDLAIMGDDTLIIGEVKSDRDCVDRLLPQVRAANAVTPNVWVFSGRKLAEKVGQARQENWADRFDLFIETDDGVERERGWGAPRIDLPRNGWRLLGILMKPELQAMAAPFGGRSRMTCTDLMALIHDGMTGADLRRSAMKALRSRKFYWADKAGALASDAPPPPMPRPEVQSQYGLDSDWLGIAAREVI